MRRPAAIHLVGPGGAGKSLSDDLLVEETGLAVV
jgi:hypothetical protein